VSWAVWEDIVGDDGDLRRGFICTPQDQRAPPDEVSHHQSDQRFGDVSLAVRVRAVNFPSQCGNVLVQKINCSIRSLFSQMLSTRKEFISSALEISKGVNIRVSKRHIPIMVTTDKAKITLMKAHL
jgi:hypothetical protein